MPQNSASPKSHDNTSNVHADATGQLDILDADDILESDDISALEAAAAGITSFEVAAPSDPSGFEVGEVGAFDEVEVEGAPASIPPAPVSLSTLFGIAPPAKKAAPMVTAAAIEVAIPTPASPTYPSANDTSPLPVVKTAAVVESVVVAQEQSLDDIEEIEAEPIADRTLELKRSDYAMAAAAAKIDAEEKAAAAAASSVEEIAPGHTEVLVRSAMPAALQTMRGGMEAPRAPQASIAPVAVDVAAVRPMMHSVAPLPPPARMPSQASFTPPKKGLSGLAIGAIALAALALVSFVGIGGYAASRALTEKAEPTVASAPSDTNGASESAAAPSDPGSLGAVVAPESGNSTGTTGSAIDVSSLPTATPPSAAPRVATGRTTVTSAPVAAAPAAPAAPRGAAGSALAAPGGPSKQAQAPGAAGAPLPPPAAPAPVAAPAAPAVVATTGVVRVDPNLRAVVIDGSYRRANDGSVTVACGTHRVKAGMKDVQVVNVPCGGSVSVN